MMSTLNADSFEDLTQKCVLSDFQHLMLYVFVRIGTIDPTLQADHDDGTIVVQVLFDAHQPVAPGMTFQSVREVADAQNTDWNMVVVGLAKNSDASLPNETQAQSFLADMREKVMVGDIDEYALLDRNGQAAESSIEVVPFEGSTSIN